jgi:hypothetical protein
MHSAPWMRAWFPIDPKKGVPTCITREQGGLVAAACFGSARPRTFMKFLCVSVSVRARAGPSEARLVPEAPPIRTQSEAQERERPVGVSTRRHLTKQQSGP